MLLLEGKVYAHVFRGMVISILRKDFFNWNADGDSVIDITDMDPQPSVNWTYENGVFTEPQIVLI